MADKIVVLDVAAPVTAEELKSIGVKRASARRNFLKNVGLASAGIAAGALIEGCSSNSKVMASGPSEADVLNFALNLEYLEAEFYSMAVNGVRLSAAVAGGTSTATGGAQVTFTDPIIAAVAADIANDEAAHVSYLRTALASAAVAEPVINLDALGIGFANQTDFLKVSRALEDTGVSAYAGAATLLTTTNLQAAAQILATEAYHAGNIRFNIVQKGIVVTALDSQDVIPDMTHFFTTDSNALAIKRTTSQVLAIVYGNATAGTSSGGFFPNGLNGNIKTV